MISAKVCYNIKLLLQNKNNINIFILPKTRFQLGTMFKNTREKMKLYQNPSHTYNTFFLNDFLYF